MYTYTHNYNSCGDFFSNCGKASKDQILLLFVCKILSVDFSLEDFRLQMCHQVLISCSSVSHQCAMSGMERQSLQASTLFIYL